MVTTGEDRTAAVSPLHEDAAGWRLAAPDARGALRLRSAFREYLLAHAHPSSDFHAAEVVYGELLANCARHAPGPVRVEFRWDDATLAVTDSSDRLRSWPFSPDDWVAESTHHGYALLSAMGRRVHLAREPGGGTRASVVLPVVRAGEGRP